MKSVNKLKFFIWVCERENICQEGKGNKSWQPAGDRDETGGRGANKGRP